YLHGVLADSNYRLTIPGGWVVDDALNTLTQSYVADFFWLRGDLNRDRTVSIADFITLASNFGKTNASYADGDVNYDGEVTIGDFIDLAANFNKSLAEPTPQPGAGIELTTSIATPTVKTADKDLTLGALHPRIFPRFTR